MDKIPAMRLVWRDMTGLTGKIWIALVAVALCSGTALAASFTASLDRDSMEVGDRVTLSLTFEGGQADNVPTPDVCRDWYLRQREPRKAQRPEY